ncbi:MAG: hypothetical protein ACRBN8_24225 [Nannocystales bacterium]
MLRKAVIRVCTGTALVFGACDSGDPDDGAGGDGGETEATSAVPNTTADESEGGGSSGGPQIVEVTVSTETLGSNGVLELTVQVTHEDSLDELVGVVIRHEGVVLGAFAQVAGGTFVYAVSFQELSELYDGVQTPVVLSVEVLDNNGQQATEQVELSLCASGEAACPGGACVDLDTSFENCGECGYACGANEECQHGNCDYDYDYDYVYGTGPGADAPDGEDGEVLSRNRIPTSSTDEVDVAAFNL